MSKPLLIDLCMPRFASRVLLLLVFGLLTGVSGPALLAIAKADSGETHHAAAEDEHEEHEHSHPGHPHSSSAPHRLRQLPWWLLGGYGSLIVVASLFGGWLPSLVNLTHTRLQLMVSFVGGLMLGIGLFHLLPHAVLETGSVDRSVWWMVVGVVTTFLLIRVFRVHQHAVTEAPDAHAEPAEHHHEDHLHPAAGHHHHEPTAVHPFSWIGIALGLTLHSLMDGMAVAASVLAETGHDATWSGLGAFLAVLLHKPLDAAAITSMMAAGKWSRQWRHGVNVIFSLTAPVGAALFLFGAARIADHQAALVGCALAFSAGVFLCISLGDLLPEMEFHSHNRLPLTALLLLGLAAAYGIRYLEPGHVHEDGGGPSAVHRHEH